MCRLLLEDTKVDPDQATIRTGHTAFHSACQQGKVEVCQVLLQTDADLGAYETGEQRARPGTQGRGMLCTSLLQQATPAYADGSSNRHALDESGLRPIDLAQGKEEIRQLL